MKITKYNHSCLLVEDTDNQLNTLIDPGNYSADVLDVEKLPKLNYLLITHTHHDHCYLPFIKQVLAKNPDVTIITTSEVVEQLAKENITATNTGDGYITVEPVPHEKVWAAIQAQNIMVTVGGRLAHPGDSHTFSTNAEILALPVAAPWGSTTKAVEIAEQLHPKVIIPIHDFMLKDDNRQGIYGWIKAYLSPKGIDFRAVETGSPIEV